MRADRLVRAGVVLVFAVVSIVAGGCGAQRTPTIRIDGDPRSLPPPGLTDGDLAHFTGVVAGARGRPVVVNVWASWCAPCRVEAPLLERAATEYGQDVQFLGVASRDDRGDAEAFLRRFDVSYPNLLDTSGGIRKFLSVRGLPSTYVFDGRGRLVAQVVGAVDEQKLAGNIDEAIRRS